MSSKSLIHVFLVTFPSQGLVNPLLRLGKHLAFKGLLVTLSAPQFISPNLCKANDISDQPTQVGDGMIRFAFFDDGWDVNDPKRFIDADLYVAQLELVGKHELPQKTCRGRC
ncbi:UDP-glycosyltransferase 84A1 [Abeliophyllum distichum]|uniref:UDP-glycosyltransferase 84A1 n=1 Tax=Abeliophyllum distichum TaxID=126358 RepID=A0ABD1RQE4_9LAMI